MDRHNFKSRQACGLKNDVMRSKAPTLPTYTRRTHHPIHLKCTRFYAHKHHPLTCPHFLMAHIHRTKATEKKGAREEKKECKKTHRYNKTNGSRNRHGRWQFSEEVAKNAFNPNANQIDLVLDLTIKHWWHTMMALQPLAVTCYRWMGKLPSRFSLIFFISLVCAAVFSFLFRFLS